MVNRVEIGSNIEAQTISEFVSISSDGSLISSKRTRRIQRLTFLKTVAEMFFVLMKGRSEAGSVPQDQIANSVKEYKKNIGLQTILGGSLNVPDGYKGNFVYNCPKVTLFRASLENTYNRASVEQGAVFFNQKQ